MSKRTNFHVETNQFEDFVAKGIKSALSALSPSPMVALVSGELARATEGALVAVPIGFTLLSSTYPCWL